MIQYTHHVGHVGKQAIVSNVCTLDTTFAVVANPLTRTAAMTFSQFGTYTLCYVGV